MHGCRSVQSKHTCFTFWERKTNSDKTNTTLKRTDGTSLSTLVQFPPANFLGFFYFISTHSNFSVWYVFAACKNCRQVSLPASQWFRKVNLFRITPFLPANILLPRFWPSLLVHDVYCCQRPFKKAAYGRIFCITTSIFQPELDDIKLCFHCTGQRLRSNIYICVKISLCYDVLLACYCLNMKNPFMKCIGRISITFWLSVFNQDYVYKSCKK